MYIDRQIDDDDDKQKPTSAQTIQSTQKFRRQCSGEDKLKITTMN